MLKVASTPYVVRQMHNGELIRIPILPMLVVMLHRTYNSDLYIPCSTVKSDIECSLLILQRLFSEFLGFFHPCGFPYFGRCFPDQE